MNGFALGLGLKGMLLAIKGEQPYRAPSPLLLAHAHTHTHTHTLIIVMVIIITIKIRKKTHHSTSHFRVNPGTSPYQTFLGLLHEI